MAGRSVLVGAAALLVFALFGGNARAEGKYQTTKDGKTLVWNGNPKPGDTATWSGNRDWNDYAHGFGLLTWYEKERGKKKPQVYARYWGRMVNGKLEGPVNVHAKRKTRYAIFIEGKRVTGWARGTAPLRAAARWRSMAANRARANFEPESPAAGPVNEMSAIRSQRSDDRGQPPENESIQDLYNERWPKIDIDDSLRLLAFPPNRLRR